MAIRNRNNSMFDVATADSGADCRFPDIGQRQSYTSFPVNKSLHPNADTF